MLHAFPRPFLPPAGVGILSIVTKKNDSQNVSK